MLLLFLANLGDAAGIVAYPYIPISTGGKGNGISLSHEELIAKQYQERVEKVKQKINIEDSEQIMIVKFTLKNFIV